MRLSALLSALPPDGAPHQLLRPQPEDDPVVRGIRYDSRDVAPGDVFFALRGAEADGHDYLEQALELGATALFVEELPKHFELRDRTAVVVRDTRCALAPIAVRFYGEPCDELTLVGVTGTNGKTSVTYLVESILAQAGRRVGLIGTVEVRYAGERQRALNTTPESLDLQRTLRAMRTHGVDTTVMEVSSHGLEMGRVDGCRFDVAAFTNLTQDHLDFHGSMESYLQSKLRLFDRHLAPHGTAVVNIDDPAAASVLAAARDAGARVLRVSRDAAAPAEIRLLAAQAGLDGTRARLALPDAEIDVALPLVGDFNLENLLVSCGIALAREVEPSVIAAGAARCPQVPGRVERVGADLPDAPTVVIDYAHTPDAVEKLVTTLQPLCDGRLIAVFGCGGDRDRAKRPLMAAAVARHADRVIATSDNPRTEDPERILDDVETGLHELRRVEPESLDGAHGAYARVVDRREAIALAVRIARPGDLVAIAGKGHEDYQIVGRQRIPFHDGEEALRALRERSPR